MNLYEIANKYRYLLDIIEENEGEITTEIDEQLKITQEELEDKIYAYYSFIKTLEANNSMIDDEVKRLRDKSSSNSNKIDRFRKMILNACLEFGYDGKSGNKKIDLDLLKAYTVNKDKVEIEDEAEFIKHNGDFTNVDLTFPGDMNFIYDIMKYAISIAKDKELVKELNSDIRQSISKSRLNNALQLKRNIKGVKVVNNPYVIIR